ncbi:MAG: sensor histidine kinase, partial [Hypericibacter sp.]
GKRAFGPIQEKYLEYAGHIGESGTHLLSIINDILDLSKAEANRLALDEGTVDIQRVVAVSANVLQDMVRKAEIDCGVTVEDGLPAFRGDAVKLRQILINLLGNAIKFTPAGGTVSLTVGRGPDGGLSFMIRDTGIGIPADKIPVALAPFGQVDSRLARRFGGAGLGLPLTKRLIELHGGTMQITSEVNAGTTVRASFPPERFLGKASAGASPEDQTNAGRTDAYQPNVGRSFGR